MCSWSRVNNLSDSSAQQILDLSAQLSARQTVVLYGFGQMKAIDSLARAGCLLHREPLNDAALANIVRSTRPALTDASWGLPHLNDPVPPRQFSDAVLQRGANIPSQVLCECPRHVAELIGQLGRFEDYSLDCLQQSPKTASCTCSSTRWQAQPAPCLKRPCRWWPTTKASPCRTRPEQHARLNCT
ncbi:hypothetical protein GHT06_007199 [Daphnia sinensis]|uniref:Uncharacterized protein n=1 Tax=Daphnia sinensis TaxID=1820382 RepID=A0AAD5PKH0_9CRUS|nr:hypothetical protein GHT06_006655 [Daphnia sinensis]KAI9549325.1 hypothetical protein GHT06_006624 [Daphnia sinensis]KAI9549399.1 hypothetical protein GHT06_007199 [Daphnia sinensis]